MTLTFSLGYDTLTFVDAHHLLLLTKNKNNNNNNNPIIFHYNSPKNRHNFQSSSTLVSFPFLFSNHHHSLTRITFKHSKLHSILPWNNSSQKPLKPKFSSETILLFVYFLIFLSLRLVFSLLPPDFPQRWNNLIVFSEEAEIRASDYPSHLWQAVVASEDRRFFRHCGIDHIGIARAVLSWSTKGGGSTITQQEVCGVVEGGNKRTFEGAKLVVEKLSLKIKELVKNTLLKNERTFSRKAIEMLLAMLLERRISKWKILCSYLSKIYWGHGIYGIESASFFYFGKHPSLLSLGESAMLAGTIPAPEIRSPLRDPNRGKTSQVRALRRMVEVSFLDIETALAIVEEPLHLRIHGPQHSNRLYFSEGAVGDSSKQGDRSSTAVNIWDWERESSIWELREYMERWAVRIQKRISAVIFAVKPLNYLSRN